MPGEGEVAVLVDFGGLSSVADREPIRLESDPSEGEPFFGLDPGPAGTPTGREQVGHVDAENGDPNERTGRWCNRKDCGNRALLMKLRPPMNVGLGGCGPRALGLGGGLKKQVKLVALPRNHRSRHSRGTRREDVGFLLLALGFLVPSALGNSAIPRTPRRSSAAIRAPYRARPRWRRVGPVRAL